MNKTLKSGVNGIKYLIVGIMLFSLTMAAIFIVYALIETPKGKKMTDWWWKRTWWNKTRERIQRYQIRGNGGHSYYRGGYPL